MRRCILIALAMLFNHSVAVAVQLQYLPAVPVQHTSKLAFELEEPLPILKLSTKGHQLLKFELTLNDSGKALPLTKLPLSLTLKLKDLFIFLDINGMELTIDPRGKKTSVPLIQLAQLLDKPMAFNVNSNGLLVEEGDTLKAIFKQYPALKELQLDLILNELFSPVFSLCGEELEIGKKFQKMIASNSAHLVPSSFAFTVTDINEQEITASMEGEISPKMVAFAPFMTEDSAADQKMQVSVSGRSQGTISWKRSNALLYSLNNQYHYQAEVVLGSLRFTMQMNISHSSWTNELSPLKK